MTSSRSTSRPRAAGLVLAAVVLGAVVAVSGCGVSASSTPEDIGDAASANLPADTRTPPQPDAASSPEALVDDYLQAASGGGVTARDQVKSFLTERAQRSWQPTDKNVEEVTVIRLVGTPPKRSAEADRGVPVDITYQVVGKLSDLGRVSNLQDPEPTNRTATFWVVRAGERSSELRIDSIEGAPSTGLYISDTALTTFYRAQSIYFWDGDVLVPDLRYVPLTINLESQANKILRWLILGPSPVLGGVDHLPINTTLPVGVVPQGNNTLIVKLSGQAADNLDARRRLVYQLQASLRFRPTPFDIQLWVGADRVQDPGAYGFVPFCLTNQLDTDTRKFDIVAGKVKPLPSDGVVQAPAVPVLGSKDNQGVVTAAVSRDLSLAAFVQRRPSNALALVIARADGGSKAVALPATTEASRPAWIPHTQQLLIAWNRRLYVVGADGARNVITPGGVTAVTAVAVSPDGRRVALIADGRAQVAELSGVGSQSGATVGAPLQRLVLDPTLVPNGIAWQSEQDLYVTGASGGAPALWRVTADGVVAENKSGILGGVAPTDVVASPKGTFAFGGVVILQSQSKGPYSVGDTRLSTDSAKQPFFIA